MLASDGRARPYRMTVEGSAALEAVLGELRSIVEEGTARMRARVSPGVTTSLGLA